MFGRLGRLRLSLAIFTITAAGTAHASVLLPGATAPPDVFGAITGTVLASQTNPFTSVLGAADFSGTYTAEVVRGGADTVCPAGGCLDFIYQATNNGPHTLVTVVGSSFDSFTVDAGFATSAGTLTTVAGDIAPSDVTRGITGSGVNFDFLTPDLLGAGDTTAVLVIETDATHFTSGHVSFIDDGTSTNPAYQPAPVPEPTSLTLFGTALIGLGAFLRRTRKRA